MTHPHIFFPTHQHTTLILPHKLFPINPSQHFSPIPILKPSPILHTLTTPLPLHHITPTNQHIPTNTHIFPTPTHIHTHPHNLSSLHTQQLPTTPITTPYHYQSLLYNTNYTNTFRFFIPTTTYQHIPITTYFFHTLTNPNQPQHTHHNQPQHTHHFHDQMLKQFH